MEVCQAIKEANELEAQVRAITTGANVHAANAVRQGLWFILEGGDVTEGEVIHILTEARSFVLRWNWVRTL
jgi:hypothetical protein